MLCFITDFTCTAHTEIAPIVGFRYFTMASQSSDSTTGSDFTTTISNDPEHMLPRTQTTAVV